MKNTNRKDKPSAEKFELARAMLNFSALYLGTLTFQLFSASIIARATRRIFVCVATKDKLKVRCKSGDA